MCFRVDLVTAPSSGPHYTNADVCAADTLVNNGASLALDTAGLLAGLLPGGGVATWGAQTALAAGSLWNSTANSPSDMVGTGTGLTGYFTTAFMKPGGGLDAVPFFSKAIPFVGTIASGIGVLNDLRNLRNGYNNCLSELAGGH